MSTNIRGNSRVLNPLKIIERPGETLDSYVSFSDYDDEAYRDILATNGLPYSLNSVTDDSAYYDGDVWGYEG